MDADVIISALHAALSSFSPSAAAALSQDTVCLAHAAAARAPAPIGGAFVSAVDAGSPDADAEVATFRVDELLVPRTGDDDAPLLREAVDGYGEDAYEEAFLAFFDDTVGEAHTGRRSRAADEVDEAGERGRDVTVGRAGGGDNAECAPDDSAAVFAWERGDGAKRARTE